MKSKITLIALALTLVFSSVSFAMDYTHTFHITMNKHTGGTQDIQGEIVFNGGETPTFKTEDPLTDVELRGMSAFGELLRAVLGISQKVGEIEKIKFEKKP